MAQPRKFDHDEARRLRAADPKRWSYPALAARFGVSENSIGRLFNPRLRAYMDASAARRQRAKREPCLGGCGRLVWQHTRDRTGYCPTCIGVQRAVGVEADTLRCSRCGEQKPDDAFPRHRGYKARRGRANLCRDCGTIARREYREARKVPCSHGCGRMVLHEQRDPKPPECHPCAMRRISAARGAGAPRHPAPQPER